jgi:hypothetical protein
MLEPACYYRLKRAGEQLFDAVMSLGSDALSYQFAVTVPDEVSKWLAYTHRIR